ncbi:MAG TPA: hypothetical protein VF618_14090 [Thermoanaerobaculia bacterium]
MTHVGRLLQIAGLIILPVALSIGVFGGDVRLEVKLLFIGGGVFLLGWILGQKTRK